MKLKIKNKLVNGVGVNDADYEVTRAVGDKRVICPLYQVWAHMLERCYSNKCLVKHKSYADCSVCPDWLRFMSFRNWMLTQDWRGKELDKDILSVGNRVYSPKNCVFVDKMTNVFTIDRKSDRGDWPLGVCFDAAKNKFSAQCSNPFTKKRGHVGYFDCPQKAHQAWRKRKHELACQLADLQADDRVAAALRLRYA